MLHDIVRMTTVAHLLYASPAWWGFAGQQVHNRLQSVMDSLVDPQAAELAAGRKKNAA